jgi:YHS domain-containing protein
MFRAIIELIVTIVLAMAARAILSSLMKGFAGATRSGFNQPADQAKPATEAKERVKTAGDLHKDPVCGTYVAESTRYKRGSGREAFYYCSEVCKEKHAVTARG